MVMHRLDVFYGR